MAAPVVSMISYNWLVLWGEGAEAEGEEPEPESKINYVRTDKIGSEDQRN